MLKITLKLNGVRSRSKRVECGGELLRLVRLQLKRLLGLLACDGRGGALRRRAIELR
jgi:hypothetical protein